MQITADDVVKFKEEYCDEERLIAGLLQQRLAHHFEEPILDVGSGTGNIAAAAFPDREVIHIDLLDFSDHELPPRHRRVKAGFFEFMPDFDVKTLLFSHVLQYIDDDVELLNEKINSFAPGKVVFVVNDNDDMKGKLVDWAAGNLACANPEVVIPGTPDSHSLVEQAKFTAQVICPDFATLTREVVYLLDAKTSADEDLKLEGFLRAGLERPCFSINQSIRVYA